MSKQTANSFFISSPFQKYAALYQDLLRGVASYYQLGCRLTEIGEHAHAHREFNRVREISQLLSSVPLNDFQAISTYFLAVATNNMGKGDQYEAQKLFETVVENAPEPYKAKALLSLAAVSANRGDLDSELFYLLEGAKASPSLSISLSSQRGIAIVKAKEGFHNQSLQALEKSLPLIKFSQPLIYFDYLNSLAVELGEVGKVEEARNVCKIVLASPYINAYPEWRETHNEIEFRGYKSRSFVGFVRKSPHTENIYQLPVPVLEASTRSVSPWRKRAKILYYSGWKKMDKEANGIDIDDQDASEMTGTQMVLRIMQIASSKDLSDEALREMVEALEKIAKEHQQKNT